jgi:hypothetical protein
MAGVMASVQKRRHRDRDVYRVMWRDADGHQRNKVFDKAREAREWAATIQAEVDEERRQRGVAQHVDPLITLATYAESHWLPAAAVLGGHLKSGHSWTLQNRPPRSGSRQWRFNLRRPVPASRSAAWSANSGDRT